METSLQEIADKKQIAIAAISCKITALYAEIDRQRSALKEAAAAMDREQYADAKERMQTLTLRVRMFEECRRQLGEPGATLNISEYLKY